MNNNYEKLKDKLLELFMLDQSELDFGIYRIMNSKRDEITQFLDKDLLPQVKKAFEGYLGTDRAALEDELEKAVEAAKSLGADPDTTPKVKELKVKISQEADSSALENEVYSDLYNFFRRYFKDGDFLSLRRYKEGVYAIPYEGEEVKLYWANHDQYYIKSSEYLRDYRFSLPNGKMVHFKLKDAEIEKDNRKATDGEKRFVLAEEASPSVENGELVIAFNYLTKPKNTKQDSLNKTALEALLAEEMLACEQYSAFKQLLDVYPTEKNKKRTLLEKHLTDYTSRNSFDYFIHKDLGGFLRRELDFFIKNEIMHLDDIESETAPKVEQYLAKIKVLRMIAGKVIKFLAQLENFQKKLWLKKKFITETNYCITLDRVAEGLLPEVFSNLAQWEEWEKLGFVDVTLNYFETFESLALKESTPEITSIEAKFGDSEPYKFNLKDIETVNLNYDFKKCEPGTTLEFQQDITLNQFVKQNPYLVLDTVFFSEDFKEKLIGDFTDFDVQCDGLLIHSENFQALNLLQERYRSQVKCIYTDPPYNTNASEIIYKNGYKHSSWCSLMYDRIATSRALLSENGILQVAIDDLEFSNLESIVKEILGWNNHICNIAIMHNPKGRDQGFVADCHEYTIIASKNKSQAVTYRLKLDDKSIAQKYPQGSSGNRWRELPLRRSGSGAQREDRPKMFYPFLYDPNLGQLKLIPQNEYSKIWNGKSFNDKYVSELRADYEQLGFLFILPIRQDGSLGRWRWGYDSALEGCETGDLVCKTTNEPTIYQIDKVDDTVLPKTLWYGDRFDASSKGTNMLKAMIPSNKFDYPKSVLAIMDMLKIASAENAIILDFFAGSGTTGHAAINLKREEGESRKYVLAEMGEHFDSVLKPRIQKAVYSADWKEGKPATHDTGISHCFKYIRLESYEDALNNLAFKRTDTQGKLVWENDSFRESYMLGYMLDTEAKGSQSLLNTDAFENPFEYKLNIASGNVGETKPVCVDLVETFNYLLGLKVAHTYRSKGFKVVEGETLSGERVLVIWRNTKENDNNALDEFFKKRHYSTQDLEFDLIYVNGDNNLENLKKDEDTWKVRMIEEEFGRLMFDVQDV